MQAHTLASEDCVQWEPFLQVRLCQTTSLQSLALFVGAKWRRQYRKKGWSLVKILDKNDEEFEHPAETVWGALELAPICVLLGCSSGNTASRNLRIILSLKLESGQEQLTPDLATFSFVSQAKYGFHGIWRFSTADQLDEQLGKEDDDIRSTLPPSGTLNSATGIASSDFVWPDKGRRVLPTKATFEEDPSKIKSVLTEEPENALTRADINSSSPHTFRSSPPMIVGTSVKAAMSADGIPRAMPQLPSILKWTSSSKRKIGQTSSSAVESTVLANEVDTDTFKRNHHSDSKKARNGLTPIHGRGKKKHQAKKPTPMPMEKQDGTSHPGEESTEKQHSISPTEAEFQDEIERNLELARRQAELQRMSSEADRALNPIPLTPRKSRCGKKSVA